MKNLGVFFSKCLVQDQKIEGTCTGCKNVIPRRLNLWEFS